MFKILPPPKLSVLLGMLVLLFSPLFFFSIEFINKLENMIKRTHLWSYDCSKGHLKLPRKWVRDSSYGHFYTYHNTLRYGYKTLNPYRLPVAYMIHLCLKKIRHFILGNWSKRGLNPRTQHRFFLNAYAFQGIFPPASS